MGKQIFLIKYISNRHENPFTRRMESTFLRKSTVMKEQAPMHRRFRIFSIDSCLIVKTEVTPIIIAVIILNSTLSLPMISY